MACDICGNNKDELVTLLDSYKSVEVAQICPDCEKIVNKQHVKIGNAVYKIKVGWMKRFLINLKGSYK